MRIRKSMRTLAEKQCIYEAYIAGDLSMREMAKHFAIGTATIYKIVREIEHERQSDTKS